TATFNCALIGVPVINAASGTLVAEDCMVDGKADPGETVTAQICFSNTGGANTTDLVATLAATGGVTNPTPASQNYGGVTAGGAAICRTFTFRVDPSLVCGTNVVATFTLNDDAMNLGTFNFTFPSGTRTTLFAENFDEMTAPAFSAGWTTTNAAGAAPLWVASTGTSDSAPNAAFVDDPAVVSDKILEMPPMLINSTIAQLTFRNNFNL